jgi:hypothetical protein
LPCSGLPTKPKQLYVVYNVRKVLAEKEKPFEGGKVIRGWLIFMAGDSLFDAFNT